MSTDRIYQSGIKSLWIYHPHQSEATQLYDVATSVIMVPDPNNHSPPSSHDPHLRHYSPRPKQSFRLIKYQDGIQVASLLKYGVNILCALSDPLTQQLPTVHHLREEGTI